MNECNVTFERYRTSDELKIRAIFSFLCVTMWSLITYSNCFKCNLLNEQMIISLSAMLLLKVCFHLI